MLVSQSSFSVSVSPKAAWGAEKGCSHQFMLAWADLRLGVTLDFSSSWGHRCASCWTFLLVLRSCSATQAGLLHPLASTSQASAGIS